MLKFLSPLTSLYRPRIASTIVYMLQSTEYQVWPYLHWFWRTQNFSAVMYRRTLDTTKAARLLRLALLGGMSLQVLLGLLSLSLWKWHHFTGGAYFGLALVISYPIVWAHLVTIPLLLGRWFIILPRQRQQIGAARAIFAQHPGVKIAVAGSYGKTSMKELLLTVLSEGKKVAATPANKNVASSHAIFAAKLAGDEDILIIEFGEAAPGDVLAFAKTVQPTHGIITGIAPAHLDHYKTVARAAADIFSLATFLKFENVYANGDSPAVIEHAPPEKDISFYTKSSVLGWKVKDIELAADGTSFTLSKGKKHLKLRTGLLGVHQVGPLGLAAALGLELGLTEKQVTHGIAQTKAFEHRMQPYALSGAAIIDDTYNGNLEGLRAGTALLASLKAKRKIYVTPGLVDQGKAAKAVHLEAGALIAKAQPDIVVLMQNSALADLRQGLQNGGFRGELKVEDDPLDFYTNLKHFVAAGDLVLMQNDWTDNYA